MPELSTLLLDQAHLASVPGPVFGAQGARHLRFVFNAPVPQIEAGCERLARFLAALR
jgi:aspartate aminotransferase